MNHRPVTSKEDSVRILLIGSTGHIGSAVHRSLSGSHDVIVASRSTSPAVDIEDPTSIKAMFDAVGQVDAVVTTVGSVPFKTLDQLSRSDFLAGLGNKVLGQVEVVRQGLPYVTDGGSFTLTTGVVGREIIRTGVAAAMANGALEYFVPAAAAEAPRGVRINAVSPTVLAEAPSYHDTFPGFIPVPAATAAKAYVKSIEGIQTGQIFVVDR